MITVKAHLPQTNYILLKQIQEPRSLPEQTVSVTLNLDFKKAYAPRKDFEKTKMDGVVIAVSSINTLLHFYDIR